MCMSPKMPKPAAEKQTSHTPVYSDTGVKPTGRSSTILTGGSGTRQSNEQMKRTGMGASAAVPVVKKMLLGL